MRIYFFSYCSYSCRNNLEDLFTTQSNCISVRKESRVDRWIGEHVFGRKAMVVKMASMMLVELTEREGKSGIDDCFGC